MRVFGDAGQQCDVGFCHGAIQGRTGVCCFRACGSAHRFKGVCVHISLAHSGSGASDAGM